MSKWSIGDRVHLVPVVPTAPSIAYRQPPCRILAIRGSRVEVELDDGHQLETSIRNLSLRPIEPPNPPAPKPRRRLALAENEVEETLW